MCVDGDRGHPHGGRCRAPVRGLPNPCHPGPPPAAGRVRDKARGWVRWPPVSLQCGGVSGCGCEAANRACKSSSPRRAQAAAHRAARADDRSCGGVGDKELGAERPRRRLGEADQSAGDRRPRSQRPIRPLPHTEWGATTQRGDQGSRAPHHSLAPLPPSRAGAPPGRLAAVVATRRHHGRRRHGRAHRRRCRPDEKGGGGATRGRGPTERVGLGHTQEESNV